MATKISWCDETINPVVGCSKISTGCQNCYAESMARRLAAMRHVQYMHVTENGCWNGKTCFVPSELEKPYNWRKPRSVFISSMGDVFHESAPFSWMERVLGMVASNPQHTFIMLTKRAQRMKEFFTTTDMAGQLACLYQLAAGTNPETCQQDNWPLPNLALGVSVENQVTADERIPYLLSTLAAKRFVSLEPMLGPIDLTRLVIMRSDAPERGKPDVSFNALTGWHGGANRPEKARLNGVILGGESGPKGRHLAPMWVMEVRDQCAAAGVPFMFKQWNHENRNEVDPDTGFPWLGSQTHSELAW